MNQYIERNGLKFEIEIKWLGLADYDHVYNLQNQLHQQLVNSKDNKIYILGLEHPSVITLGKRSKVEQDLTLDEYSYSDKKILIRKIDRGGFATLHNPGQLVIYPILNLHSLSWSIKDYVSVFQGTIRDQIKDLGIDCFCSVEDPGVYTQVGKLVSIGLRIHQQITMHGASVNIENNLHEFQYLNPCGKNLRSMDRLRNYSPISTQEFFSSWVDQFILKIGYCSDTCG